MKQAYIDIYIPAVVIPAIQVTTSTVTSTGCMAMSEFSGRNQTMIIYIVYTLDARESVGFPPPSLSLTSLTTCFLYVMSPVPPAVLMYQSRDLLMTSSAGADGGPGWQYQRDE